MSRSRKKTPIHKYGQYVTKSQANRKLRRANEIIIRTKFRYAILPRNPEDLWKNDGDYFYQAWFEKEFKLKREIVNPWDIYDFKSTYFPEDIKWLKNYIKYTDQEVSDMKRKALAK